MPSKLMAGLKNIMNDPLAKIGKAKPKGKRNRRRFDPAVRQEMKDARAGKTMGKGKAIGRRSLEEDLEYSQGGQIPSRFRKKAKRRQTSIPME